MVYRKSTSPEDLIKRLRIAGLPEEAAKAIAFDIATNENAAGLLSEYEQDFSIPLLYAESRGPFEMPGSRADGELRFALTKSLSPIGLNTDDVHTVVAGSSKTGKSITVEIINSEAVAKGHKVWLFIKTDDSTRLIRRDRNILYCDFLQRGFKVNPLLFLPEGIFVSIFRYSFALFEGSEAYLTDSISELKARNNKPALLDLLYFIRAQKLGAFSRTARHQESVLGRLKEIIASPLAEIFNCVEGHERDIVKASAIFNVSCLPLPLQKFFICSMIELLYLNNLER